MDNEILKKIKQETEKYFKNSRDPCHDFSHCLRVHNLAIHLQDKEGGDYLVIGASSLMHDLHQALGQRYRKRISAEESLGDTKKILNATGFPINKRGAVLYCIQAHDQYEFTKQGNRAETIEAKIIQDADNLDALGAIGIARTFSYGGFHNIIICDEREDNAYFDPSKNASSTIQHFYDKLLRLKDNMNTQTAKEIAKERHLFLEIFLKQFLKEGDF